MRALPLILLILTFARLDRHFFKENGSFSPSHIYPNWKNRPHQPSTNDPTPYLNQPYTYLGKGNEYFAFESGDHKYVLKLFRLPKHTRKYSWRKTLSSSTLTRRFENAQLAATTLSLETEILASHLSPTSSPPIHLIDNLGRSWHLPARGLPFLIQRKGTPYFAHFDKLPMDKAKQLIHDTLQLFTHLYAKGVIDNDPIFEKNYGIHKNKPFLIDIGSLDTPTQLPSQKDYLIQMTNSLNAKLEKHPLHSYYLNLLHSQFFPCAQTTDL